MVSLPFMLELEKQHLDMTVRSSIEKLASLLCDEFREFGTSGRILEKDEILTSVTSTTEHAGYQIDNFEIEQLGKGHVLVTYQLSEKRGNRERSTLRSTVWRFDGHEWRMLFHQGTLQAE